MSYAVVEDIAASWERYEALTAAVVNPTPMGLILYAAGPTDEGVRIIAVWQNEEAWQRFRTDRLAPAVAALERQPLPPGVVRDLRAEHLVLGAAVNPLPSTRPHANPGEGAKHAIHSQSAP